MRDAHRDLRIIGEQTHGEQARHDTARARLESAAVERLADLRPSSVVPLRAPAAFALCAVAGAIAVATAAPEGAATGEVPSAGSALADTALELSLDVTPPAYLNQAPHVVSVEGEVTVPAGTTARLRVATHWPSVWMASAEGAPALTLGSRNGWVSELFSVDASRLLVVAAGPVPGDLRESRAVSLLVADDRVPDVSVVAPGRDIVRAPGSAEPLTVRIEASDDHRLEALELRYVRLAGGGETFTFTEGTVPLIRDESSPRRWTADVRWAIGRLGLERGESLVYRAAVRDSHPGRGWTFSDSFVIDVGTPFEAGGAGASLPEEDRRYAISQQMVKNVFLWHGRSWLRKAMEAVLTPIVETIWTKRRILEVYLNVAEFGEGVFGVQAAAQHHFGVDAADLSPTQAARLAAVLPDPQNRSASEPTSFVRSRTRSIMAGAETVAADGRAACFEE